MIIIFMNKMKRANIIQHHIKATPTLKNGLLLIKIPEKINDKIIKYKICDLI